MGNQTGVDSLICQHVSCCTSFHFLLGKFCKPVASEDQIRLLGTGFRWVFSTILRNQTTLQLLVMEIKRNFSIL